ncbi:nuclear transport factor 2 family protein [Cytophagaceae bacterium DM2B3-1]|uniref:Nuclear transport factor 2 family protein n=1 Tax=Xanthocytophaga flava TaxID=3048013 RepID=A0ABT7CF57_9BACT|nr:nuclear transport factor 2 family protein [Xanthocytophaga flavus]MDJ1491630.1 nuclear transport factor 2 family protein [Xanthocytophaga flavus]
MKFIYLSIISCILFCFTASAQKNIDSQSILKAMDEQVKAWNTGDLIKFMDGYLQSDSLQFIGSKGIVYGWKPTLERYQKSYPDAAARGTLRFEILKVDIVSKDAAFVIGKFFLTRPQVGDANGHFTLLWRKVNGKWKIVVDHTS